MNDLGQTRLTSKKLKLNLRSIYVAVDMIGTMKKVRGKRNI